MQKSIFSHIIASIFLATLSCTSSEKTQKSASCCFSDRPIDAENLIMVAKFNFEKDFELLDEKSKKDYSALYKSIQESLSLMNNNLYYQKYIQKHMRSPYGFKKFDKICLVYYAYEGEVSESINVILWNQNKEKFLSGTFTNNNGTEIYIHNAVSAYNKLKRTYSPLNVNYTILGSYILIIEVDCNNNVWTKIIMEPDYKQEKL